MNLKCQTFLIKYVRINLNNSIPYKLEFTAIQYTKSIAALTYAFIAVLTLRLLNFGDCLTVYLTDS